MYLTIKETSRLAADKLRNDCDARYLWYIIYTCPSLVQRACFFSLRDLRKLVERAGRGKKISFIFYLFALRKLCDCNLLK